MRHAFTETERARGRKKNKPMGPEPRDGVRCCKIRLTREQAHELIKIVDESRSAKIWLPANLEGVRMQLLQFLAANPL
jgi:hypothetical protein